MSIRARLRKVIQSTSEKRQSWRPLTEKIGERDSTLKLIKDGNVEKQREINLLKMKYQMDEITGKSKERDIYETGKIKESEIDDMSSKLKEYDRDEKSKLFDLKRSIKYNERDDLENILFKTPKSKSKTAKKSQKDRRGGKSIKKSK